MVADKVYETFGQALSDFTLIDAVYQLAPYAMALASLAGPDSAVLRRGLFLPGIVWTAWKAQTEHRLGIIFYDYFASIFALCITIRAIDLLLVHHPEDFKRHGEPAPKFTEKPIAKLAWAIDLALNMRGIGWDWQVVKQAPGRPSEEVGRLRFLLRQVRDLLGTLIVGDICHSYAETQKYFRSYPLSAGPPPPLASFPIPIILLNLLVGVVFIYCALSAIHIVVSIAVVAAINAPPKDWPPAFGPLKAATSVRRFWNSTWHQELRAIFTMPAFAIAHLTGANIHTTPAKLAIGISAFIVSASLHLFPALLVPAPEGTYPHRGWDSATFFILQPIAIVTEMFLANLNAAFRRKGLPSFAKGNRFVTIAGFIWTWAWLAWTSMWFIRDLSNLGIFEFTGAPASPMRWLKGGPFILY